MDNKPKRIMSGEYSRDVWDAINSAETAEDLRDALCFVCCRLQELEGRLTTATPDTATGGYQPTYSKLDSSDPPRGGSGVPPKVLVVKME